MMECLTNDIYDAALKLIKEVWSFSVFSLIPNYCQTDAKIDCYCQVLRVVLEIAELKN